MNVNLDARLSLAYDLYDPCDTAADIGTDHAHLPIALLRGNKCRRMILTDISPDALQNARENVARAHLTGRVDFRLGDGLAVLREPCGMISILGMGGRTIQEMLLAGAAFLHGSRPEPSLLLSAHTDLPLVREAVMKIGFHLVSETPCLDAGRYYVLLKALPGEERLTPRELRLGKKLFESPAPILTDYLRHRRQVMNAKLTGLLKSSDKNEEMINELQSDIAMLDEYIPD